jgi:high-affinity iron transporter
VFSAMGIITSYYFMPAMGELFDGIGIEVIQTIESILAYFCLLFASSYLITQNKLTKCQSHLIIIGMVLFIIINASVFIFFLDSYMANKESVKNIMAGLAIGLGICLSFSALLYFLLAWFIKQEFYVLTYIFWGLFLSGQISKIVNLLQQVDIIQSTTPLWNSSHIVKDSSEYGQLLKTLFGYEASPSMEFIILYAVSLILIFCYFLVTSSTRFQHNIERNKEE